MDAWPRRELTFHGIEAGRSWDLIYDQSRATIPIGYLLAVHPGSTSFLCKQFRTFGYLSEKGNPHVS